MADRLSRGVNPMHLEDVVLGDVLESKNSLRCRNKLNNVKVSRITY